MTEESKHNGDSGGEERGGAAAPRRRSPWPLAVVAALFVVVPFLAWYGTWFGRGLSDEKIEEYLRDGKPRHAQHALSQLAERIERGDEGARRWHPQIAALAANESPDVRMTAAWVMGAEHRSEEFRAALLRLVEDPEPIVRRNAALALVRFGDPRCRAELLAMLRPYSVRADAAGTALTALTEGTPVKRESLLVKYEEGGGPAKEVRSPLPGKVGRAFVKEGDRWQTGAELFLIAPDEEQVRDALIGLYYFGQAEDLPEVERFASSTSPHGEETRRQAALTFDAIKRRAQNPQP